MPVRTRAVCLIVALGSVVAVEYAPLTAGDKKAEKNPEVVIYFHTEASDTKDTVLPTKLLIRIHAEADNYNYHLDVRTGAGQTVGKIAQQVYEDMKASGWKVTTLSSGLGVAVYGCAPTTQPAPQPYKPVTRAGIHYSGAAQPILPEARGGVQLLTLEKGKWKPMPKP